MLKILDIFDLNDDRVVVICEAVNKTSGRIMLDNQKVIEDFLIEYPKNCFSVSNTMFIALKKSENITINSKLEFIY